jgi:hypothetical protein
MFSDLKIFSEGSRKSLIEKIQSEKYSLPTVGEYLDIFHTLYHSKERDFLNVSNSEPLTDIVGRFTSSTNVKYDSNSVVISELDSNIQINQETLGYLGKKWTSVKEHPFFSSLSVKQLKNASSFFSSNYGYDIRKINVLPYIEFPVSGQNIEKDFFVTLDIDFEDNPGFIEFNYMHDPSNLPQRAIGYKRI